MRKDVYRYGFDPKVAMDEVEATLLLALLATEGIHGGSDVRLDAAYTIDEKARAIVIDATTDVGRCICRIFTSYLAHEFGEDAFHVRPFRREGTETVPASVAGESDAV